MSFLTEMKIDSEFSLSSFWNHIREKKFSRCFSQRISGERRPKKWRKEGMKELEKGIQENNESAKHWEAEPGGSCQEVQYLLGRGFFR